MKDAILIDYTSDKFRIDIGRLDSSLRKEKYDAIIAISRGGLIPATFLSHNLKIRDVYVVSSKLYSGGEQNSEGWEIEASQLHALVKKYKKGSKVLIVDDIADSGDTLDMIIRILKDECGYEGEHHCFVLVNKLYPSVSKKLNLKYQGSDVPRDNWVIFFWENIFE